MNSPLIDRYLAAFDRQQDHFRNDDPSDLNYTKNTALMHMETSVAYFAAMLEQRVKHETMKASIEGVR